MTNNKIILNRKLKKKYSFGKLHTFNSVVFDIKINDLFLFIFQLKRLDGKNEDGLP